VDNDPTSEIGRWPCQGSSPTRCFDTWTDGFPRVTEALLVSGLDESTVEGVLGANFASYFARTTA
jgi:hypothetical protein